MKINWSKWWAELTVVGGSMIYFLSPSLQSYAVQHPTQKVSLLITLILAACIKPSPLSQGKS